MHCPNVIVAIVVALVLGIGNVMFMMPKYVHRFILGLLPSWVVSEPGSGPSSQRQSKSYFKMHLVGRDEEGHCVRGIVSGGDPGGLETSKMVCEAAILLALSRRREPTMIGMGGVMTPASCIALGTDLIHSLKKAGIQFDASRI